MQKLEKDVLDIFTDIAGLGERGGIADGEGDVEYARQGLGEQCFTAAGGTDQKHVALVDFDIVAGGGLGLGAGGDATGGVGAGGSSGGSGTFAGAQALIVIVNGDGEGLLSVVLSDDELIEEFLDLSGAGNAVEKRLGGGELALFLANDVVCEIDTVGTDVDIGGSFDHGPDVAAGFAAEAARGDTPAAKSAWGSTTAIAA